MLEGNGVVLLTTGINGCLSGIKCVLYSDQRWILQIETKYDVS
jgi:hypothetical protein